MILDKIKDRIGNYDGSIGICYIDLGTGESCSAGNCDVFPASGLVKLLILIEAFKRMEEGTLKKTDKYILTEADYPNTSEKSYGALEFLHVGTELTIEDLYKLNVTVSDNMAFNVLLKMFTMEEVNRTMEKYGCRKTRIHRALLDDEETARGVKNYVSVQESPTCFSVCRKGSWFQDVPAGKCWRFCGTIRKPVFCRIISVNTWKLHIRADMMSGKSWIWVLFTLSIRLSCAWHPVRTTPETQKALCVTLP